MKYQRELEEQEIIKLDEEYGSEVIAYAYG